MKPNGAAGTAALPVAALQPATRVPLMKPRTVVPSYVSATCVGTMTELSKARGNPCGSFGIVHEPFPGHTKHDCNGAAPMLKWRPAIGFWSVGLPAVPLKIPRAV